MWVPRFHSTAAAQPPGPPPPLHPSPCTPSARWPAVSRRGGGGQGGVGRRFGAGKRDGGWRNRGGRVTKHSPFRPCTSSISSPDQHLQNKRCSLARLELTANWDDCQLQPQRKPTRAKGSSKRTGPRTYPRGRACPRSSGPGSGGHRVGRPGYGFSGALDPRSYRIPRGQGAQSRHAP
jgi:hypothetical protein